MALEVLTGSSDPFLTTTAAVKEALGLAATSTEQNQAISNAILRASRQAETIVGCPLTAQRYLETLEGFGDAALMLSVRPVRSVAALFLGTDTGEAAQVTSTEFAVDRPAALLERAGGWEWSVPGRQRLDLDPIPRDEFPMWRAEYVAGYTFDGIDTGSPLWSTEKGTTSTGRTLPEDIEAAIIKQAVNLHSHSDDGGDIESQKIGDLSIKFAQGNAGIRTGSAAMGVTGLAADLAGYIKVV